MKRINNVFMVQDRKFTKTKIAINKLSSTPFLKLEKSPEESSKNILNS